MIRKEALSYSIRIYMAGDCARAVEIARYHCDENPWCVTISPTTYCYTGGTEEGFIVGLINYPRFPSLPDRMWLEAEAIAHRLCEALGQQSYSMEAPDRTVWVSHREDAA